MALFGQWKGEIKENGTFTWELGLEVFHRSAPSLTPGANHNLKHLCVPPLWDSWARLRGKAPPHGLIRTGHGAPVKHAGRGLISSAKRALGPHIDMLNP